MNVKSTFVSVLVMICALSFVVHADVKYTIVAKYTFANTSADKSKKTDQVTDTHTYFVTPDKSRIEDVAGYDPLAPSKEVIISRCDLKKDYRLDDDLKIYTVSDLSLDGYNSPATESEMKEDIPEMKTVTHYSIQKLAPEKINGFDTECYQVISTEKYSGFAGDRESNNKMKIWVADVKGWQPCNMQNMELPTTPYSHVVTFPTGRRRYTEVYTGDVEEMNKINSQIPVRTEAITDYTEPAKSGAVDQNVTSYSPDEKLDDSLFEVPTGYRKVSSEEYKKLRSQAEVKAIRESKKSKARQ